MCVSKFDLASSLHAHCSSTSVSYLLNDFHFRIQPAVLRRRGERILNYEHYELCKLSIMLWMCDVWKANASLTARTCHVCCMHSMSTQAQTDTCACNQQWCQKIVWNWWRLRRSINQIFILKQWEDHEEAKKAEIGNLLFWPWSFHIATTTTGYKTIAGRTNATLQMLWPNNFSKTKRTRHHSLHDVAPNNVLNWE